MAPARHSPRRKILLLWITCIDIVITLVYALKMNTTIQIRIDRKMKESAQKAFKNMGLDLSSGVKYLLTQVSNPKNIVYMCPFGFLHKYTPEMIEKYEREAEQAIKSGKGYRSTPKMFDDIIAGK